MLIEKQNITESEKKAIIADADQMLEGFFHYDGVWDMEPCNVPLENKRLKWNLRYNNDPEWSYMFTRMDYLYKFLVATAITGEEKYIRNGLKIIDKWYKDNRCFLRKYSGKLFRVLNRNDNLSHRSLDVAIMISNIVDYVYYCAEHGIISAKSLRRYQKRVEKVITYVMQYSGREGKQFSNWGIIENGNVVYCLLKLKKTKYYDEAYRRLVRHVCNQISADGSQIESSPMYLVQILLVLLKILNLQENNTNNFLIEPVRSGCKYISNITNLENCIPNIGDSDVTNVSDLMHIAAHVLQERSFLSYVSRDINLEYSVKYGISREQPQKDCPVCPERVIQFRYQTVFCSVPDNAYVFCTNTPHVVDGHKHYDYMSVLYSEFGKDVLIDLGRFSYKNDDNRRFSKGPSAHNTIGITGHPYYEYVNSWISRQQIECYDISMEQGKTIMKCVFGYNDVEICREVSYDHQDGLLIMDKITNHTQNDYQYEFYFNIGPKFSLRQLERCVCIDDNSGHCLYYRNNLNLPVEIRQVQCSKEYNEQQTVFQLVLKTKERNVTHFFTKKILQ